MKRAIDRALLTATLVVGWGSFHAVWASAGEYRQLGLRYRQQGQLTEAIAALEQASQLEPNNSAGLVTLGWTLHLADRDRDAAAVLQQALQIEPAHVPALNALGIVYLVNDDLVAAALTHGWAALLAPDNEIAYYNLSLALQGMEQYDWAIATAQKAVALESDNPHPLVALAIAHWSNNQPEQAEQVYQQAIGLDRRYSSRAHLLGLEQAGFSPEQIELSETVLQAMP